MFDVLSLIACVALLTLCNFVSVRLSMYSNGNDRNIEEMERGGEREWFWFAINIKSQALSTLIFLLVA